MIEFVNAEGIFNKYKLLWMLLMRSRILVVKFFYNITKKCSDEAAPKCHNE